MLASGPGARSPRQIWPLGPDAETAPHRPDPAQDRASTAGCRDLAAWHGCLNPPTRCTGGQPAAALGQQQGGAPRRHGLVRPLTDPRDRLPQDLLRPPGGVLLRCGSFRPLNLAHDDLARRRFALAAARPVAPPPRQLLLPLLLSQHGVGRQRAAHRGRGVGPAPRQAGAILLVPDALLVTGQHQVLAAARRHGQVQGGVPLRSRGTPSHVSRQKGLITVKPPPTAATTLGWRKGSARRDDEIVTLSEAGHACLHSDNQRERSRNTVAWAQAYACGGVNTWRCAADAIVRLAPGHGSRQVGVLPVGSVIVAGATNNVNNQGCLADAATYGGMQGSDGKHKLCEDGIIVDGESAPVVSVCKVRLTHLCAACHVFKVLDKSTHPWTPELSTGHKIFDPRLVFITMTNHEDQH
jgi:hypothetical protein